MATSKSKKIFNYLKKNDFFKLHWGNNIPLKFADYELDFKGIISWEEILNTMSLTSLDSSNIFLFKEGQKYSSEKILDLSLLRLNVNSSEKFLDVKKILNLIKNEQYSLKINNVDRFSNTLFEFAQGLGSEFKHQISINSYYTPTGNSKCFHPHYDPYNIFIFQIKGSKKWKFSLRDESLVDNSQINDYKFTGELTEEITLNEGESLFLPRGTPHSACTEDQDSFHLTVGFHPVTIKHYLQFLLNNVSSSKMNFKDSLYSLQTNEFTAPDKILFENYSNELFNDFIAASFYSNDKLLEKSEIEPAPVNSGVNAYIPDDYFLKTQIQNSTLKVWLMAERFNFNEYANELQSVFNSRKFSVEEMYKLGIPKLISISLIKKLNSLSLVRVN